MKELSMRLPPFAGDYSGVASTLFLMGGLVVIHGSDGCIGNYAGYDEPRWYGSDSMVLYSELREIDTVLGNDEKLMRQIEEAVKIQRPAFICIAGTPVPMIVGTDFKGIARAVEQRTGIPSFGFPTTGFSLYDTGVSSALCAMVERFCTPAEKEPGTLNILGADAIDFCTGKAVRSIKECCRLHGFRVIASPGMDAGIENIRCMARASCNLVISSGGIKAAEYMKKTFGTPYLIDIPVGEKAAERTFACMEEKEVPRVLMPADNGEGNILILGEAVTSHAIRRYLIEDCSMDGVTICTLFTPVKETMNENDTTATCEAEIEAVINGKNWRVIIGDPLCRQLIAPGRDADFVEVPHIAISSKLYWNSHIDPVTFSLKTAKEEA